MVRRSIPWGGPSRPSLVGTKEDIQLKPAGGNRLEGAGQLCCRAVAAAGFTRRQQKVLQARVPLLNDRQERKNEPAPLPPPSVPSALATVASPAWQRPPGPGSMCEGSELLVLWATGVSTSEAKALPCASLCTGADAARRRLGLPGTPAATPRWFEFRLRAGRATSRRHFAARRPINPRPRAARARHAGRFAGHGWSALSCHRRDPYEAPLVSRDGRQRSSPATVRQHRAASRRRS